MQPHRRAPRKGEILPKREYPNGIEGFEYDWFWIKPQGTKRRDLPLPHLAGFLTAAFGLGLLTYHDLGPHYYGQRARDLLDSSGLEWVAGKLMMLQGIAEQATSALAALLT